MSIVERVEEERITENSGDDEDRQAPTETTEHSLPTVQLRILSEIR